MNDHRRTLVELHWPSDAVERILVCFPHAGAGPALFSDWPHDLPEAWAVLGVRLPGRESRLREPRHETIQAMAAEVAAALEGVAEAPLILYGHCFGAVVAFEAGLLLERRGISIEALWVGSSLSPARQHLAPRVCYKSDTEFVSDLAEFAPPIPPALIPLLLPTLRSDVNALERYRVTPGRLRASVGVVHSEGDKLVPPAEAIRWNECTSGSFSHTGMDVPHFLFPVARMAVLDHVRRGVTKEERR